MVIIDLSEKKNKQKRTGRFRVTIKTLSIKNSLHVKYFIEVEDFADEDYVRIKSANYTGSEPEKQAQRMIEQFKEQERGVLNTEVYYSD